MDILRIYVHIYTCTFTRIERNTLIPVNNFSVMSDGATLLGFDQYCRKLMCLAQGHNPVTPVGIEPRTSRIGVFALPPNVFIHMLALFTEGLLSVVLNLERERITVGEIAIEDIQMLVTLHDGC